MEPPHELDVEWLERVTGRLNKVDARVNTVVNNIRPVRFVFCLEVGIESRLDTFQNWLPTATSGIDEERRGEEATCLHC